MSEPDGQSDYRAFSTGERAGEIVKSAASGSLAAPDTTRPVTLPAQEEKAHFWDHWRVLVRYRWTVITFFLVTVIVATVWTYTTRPVFNATAVLRIEKEEPRILKFEEVVKVNSEQGYKQQTEHKILQSRTLASRVIGLLELDQHPEFQHLDTEKGWLTTAQAWTRQWLVQWIFVIPPPAPQRTEDLALESPLTHAFQKRLTVKPVRNTRLVEVSFESYYPDLAARVANTLAEEFIVHLLDQKVEATRYGTQFLAKQIAQARAKLETSEETLNRFLEKNDILFITSDKVAERQDLITQQLTVLSETLLKARTHRIAKASLFHQAFGQEVDSLPTVFQNPLVIKLKEQMVTLEGEYRKLGPTFKPEHPWMQRLAENIAEVRRHLRAEINRIVEGLNADYRAALENEWELQRAVDQHGTLAHRLESHMGRYNLLRRDVEAARELYSSLLTRFNETQVSSALLTSNMSIVDRAEVPLTPSKPQELLNLLIGSLIGLFGGVGLAFLLEYLDTNIKDAKEVEIILRVPTLGLVPSQALLEGRRVGWVRRLAERDGDSKPFALVAHAEMGSVLGEAFRNIRTNLLYSAPDHPPKTFMVTSLHTDAGKTSLATNLAVSLAQLGNGEVLLVDGDMRRPNLHKLLQVAQVPGLSTFLSGQADLPAVVKPSKIPNLYVIPSGQIPFNPAEIMSSTRLGQALQVLGNRFVHIVFDSPPLFGVSDAVILAPRVEGVVLVLRHRGASRDEAQRAIQVLTSVRARFLGVILNDIDWRAAGAAYRGYYRYSRYRDGTTGG
jgi:capsular exopolysaccharide synthesis family protein